MFQNKINLLTLFGLLMLCVALFALAVSWQFYQELNNAYDHYESTSDYWGRIGFLSFGVIWLVISIALILRQNWVRVTFISLFFIGILSWTAFLFFTLSGRERFMPFMLGLSTLVYGAMTFGILFLNNKFVLQHFDEQHQLQEEREDILDY